MNCTKCESSAFCTGFIFFTFPIRITVSALYNHQMHLKKFTFEWSIASSMSFYEMNQLICFSCFVALHPKSTAMFMVGRSVQLTTLFPWQA